MLINIPITPTYHESYIFMMESWVRGISYRLQAATKKSTTKLDVRIIILIESKKICWSNHETILQHPGSYEHCFVIAVAKNASVYIVSGLQIMIWDPPGELCVYDMRSPWGIVCGLLQIHSRIDMFTF